MKQLKIFGIAINRATQEAFSLIMSEPDSGYRIPIIIGKYEAQSILVVQNKLSPPRPFSHSAFVSIMDDFGIDVVSVYIYKVEAGVFSSFLRCRQGDTEKEFDMRTSDAIAIAVRKNAPIYIDESVLYEVGIPPRGNDSESKSSLSTQLNDAIKNEDYETAAKIRDRMRELGL